MEIILYPKDRFDTIRAAEVLCDGPIILSLLQGDPYRAYSRINVPSSNNRVIDDNNNDRLIVSYLSDTT